MPQAGQEDVREGSPNKMFSAQTLTGLRTRARVEVTSVLGINSLFSGSWGWAWSIQGGRRAQGGVQGGQLREMLCSVGHSRVSVSSQLAQPCLCMLADLHPLNSPGIDGQLGL